MNTSNFVQTGGLRVKAERLQEMQTAYNIFNSLGYTAGDLTIISGCNAIGTNTTDGIVFIDGEVLDFLGGFTMDEIIIVEESTPKEFEDGSVKPIHFIRYATFGTAETSWPWQSFTRIIPVKDLQSRLLPPGTNPQLYCGSILAIPVGWQLCDGTNATPDLRSRFIVGYNPADADYNEIGKNGGAKTVTLSEAQMPKHSHNGDTSSAGGHKHTGLTVNASNDDVGDAGPYIITSNSHSIGTQSNAGETATAAPHTHVVSTENKGNSEAHENRPPYYTLAYIIYTGI